MQVNNSVQAIGLPTQTQKQAPQAPAQEAPKSQLAQDVANTSDIKKGILPTLKGAGAGLLVGGAAGIGTAIAIDAATNMGSGALALLGIPMVAAPAGAVAGAVAANMTDSVAGGAAWGAGSGAVVGGAMGLVGGNLTFAAWGAGIGAVAGAATGAVGALLAERK